ncbi:uncharacterized protein [Hemitrygon akajei]|uniref:uncharacterized protein n=1 Tax=Hemitrygon akajei TaxID=2704970 RepID=UPI003BF9B15C
MSHGTVSVRKGDPPIPIRIWRDTGAELSLISRNVLQFGPPTCEVALRGIGKWTERVSLRRVLLDCELVYGSVEMGVPSEFPRTDVDVLLGNDLAGGKVQSAMTMTRRPMRVEAPPIESPSYPACADTRSLSRAAAKNESSLKLAETSLPTLYHEGFEGGKARNSNVKGGKGEKVVEALKFELTLEMAHVPAERLGTSGSLMVKELPGALLEKSIPSLADHSLFESPRKVDANTCLAHYPSGAAGPGCSLLSCTGTRLCRN